MPHCNYNKGYQPGFGEARTVIQMVSEREGGLTYAQPDSDAVCAISMSRARNLEPAYRSTKVLCISARLQRFFPTSCGGDPTRITRADPIALRVGIPDYQSAIPLAIDSIL